MGLVSDIAVPPLCVQGGARGGAGAHDAAYERAYSHTAARTTPQGACEDTQEDLGMGTLGRESGGGRDRGHQDCHC